MRRDAGTVVWYEGKRGRVVRIRYHDADGVRVLETLGAERDGWTDRKAEAALRERLVDVKRERRRKLSPIVFGEFAQKWLETYPDAKGLKRSTRESYTTIVERHLIPAFGKLPLDAVDLDELERYLARKRRAGSVRGEGGAALSPRTLNRHLNLLNELFTAALKRQLVRVNPVALVDRPREPRRHWTILSPAEIARVEVAFRQLAEGEPEGSPERAWLEQARVVFLTVIAAGLRRGEILGLRWRDVSLADPAGAVLQVRETWVRNHVDTPKSEAGERTISLDKVLAEELWQHRRRTHYTGDGERVFCSPLTGGALDPNRYASTLKAALAKAKIERPMRPFHDGRHTAITQDAASGNAPLAIMTRAGHSNFKTTQLYIDLAGENFREEAERLGQRLFGATIDASDEPEP
jgi:integrase